MTGNSCVILQPSYIPWRGYFHQIYKADTFVFYDDVQYDRRGWRNRNRIKTAQGSQWLTIPVKSSDIHRDDARICDIEILPDGKWHRAHFETLRHRYAKAPFFSRYEPMLKRWYENPPGLLADFAITTTLDLAHELGTAQRNFMRSSELACSGTKTERLLQILKKVKATHYISGPAAKDYLEVDLLAQEGITVEWMDYCYPEYPQLYPPFDPHVSTLDLLFMTGPDASRYIW
jgi:hypothetical protein